MTVPTLIEMKLIVLEEPHMWPGAPQPEVFDLWYNAVRPKLTLGRKVGNDIVLVDSSVSRYHLEIEVREDGLLVCDQTSKNGSFLNGLPLTPMQEVLVRPGDKLKVGDVVLQLKASYETVPSPLEGSPASPPPAKTNLALVPDSDGKLLGISADSGEEPPEPQPQQAFDFFGEPVKPNVLRDHSDLFPPEFGKKLARNQFGFQRRKPRAWFYLVLAVAITIIIGLVVLVMVFLLNSSNTTNKLAELPNRVFASPANSDSALGVIIAHPSNWIRQDFDPTRVIFIKPDSTTAALTIEKPPSRTIPNANKKPEEAVKFYIDNIKRNAKNPTISQEPIETRLVDGTPAWMAKAIFTTLEDNVSVVDYTVTALSFQCNGILYFASVGEEGRFYTGVVQQDLDASLSSISCR